MASVMVLHEVDDVDHWLSSPKRAGIFAPLGISEKTYIDPQGSNKVGVLLEVPDMEELKAILESDVGAEAMKHDGVPPETMLMLLGSEA